MLSYEKCVELRDAGFPQPVPGSGQMWLREGVFNPMLFVVGCKKHGHLYELNEYGQMEPLFCPIDSFHRTWVLQPTAEDFLSMLKPLFGLEKTASGRRWVMRGEGGDLVIGFRDAPAIDTLVYEFLNHPEYFNKPVKS